jgi:hypothetical protein
VLRSDVINRVAEIEKTYGVSNKRAYMKFFKSSDSADSSALAYSPASNFIAAILFIPPIAPSNRVAEIEKTYGVSNKRAYMKFTASDEFKDMLFKQYKVANCRESTDVMIIVL